MTHLPHMLTASVETRHFHALTEYAGLHDVFGKIDDHTYHKRMAEF